MNVYHSYGIPYVPGVAQGKVCRSPQSVSRDAIFLVTQEQLGLINDYKPAGLIVIDAAPFSHSMIQYTGLGIPIILIDSKQAECLPHDICLRIDGTSGEINQIPSAATIQGEKTNMPKSGGAVVSVDGVSVELRASVSSTIAAAQALTHGASAIGLVRTELMQPQLQTVPNTDFYVQTFKELCAAATPLSVTVRLLDIASDKQPTWLSKSIRGQSELGLQGCRLYQLETIQHVLFAQLAAIKQLVPRYDLRLIIPYVTSCKEFVHWRDVVQKRLGAPISIGAMLETPGALLDIKRVLTVADFVSIGCNDLMQCLFAADRDNPGVRQYLNPYAPVLYRFLNQVALDIGNHNDRVQVCGLLPQWPGIMPLLIAMGYRCFSVEATRIPDLAKIISSTTIENIRADVERICSASDATQVCNLLGVRLPSVWHDV